MGGEDLGIRISEFVAKAQCVNNILTVYFQVPCKHDTAVFPPNMTYKVTQNTTFFLIHLHISFFKVSLHEQDVRIGGLIISNIQMSGKLIKFLIEINAIFTIQGKI